MSSILFDLGHPAHVHLFKNLIFHLKKKQQAVLVTSRKKDVANDLLEYFGIPYISLSSPQSKSLLIIGELLKRDFSIFKLHKKYKFCLALGTSVSIAHLSALTKVKSFVFEEDDDEVVPPLPALTYPFASKIVNPKCLKFKKWEKKRLFHDSYHELAYLHPDHFSPDVSVLKKYQLEPQQYIIQRSSALKAHHDVDKKGLDIETLENLKDLIQDYHVVSSVESQGEQKILPWDMHHVLSFSKLLISDSQTMTAEAACLGVPSIRYSSFVGRISYLEELEHRYGLTFGFIPGDDKNMYAKVKELLQTANLSDTWQKKRENMLSEKIDFFKWMVKLVDSYLK